MFSFNSIVIAAVAGSTKGIEYLIAVIFLFVFLVFLKLIRSTRERE